MGKDNLLQVSFSRSLQWSDVGNLRISHSKDELVNSSVGIVRSRTQATEFDFSFSIILLLPFVHSDITALICSSDCPCGVEES
jgi:hypothetical protein